MCISTSVCAISFKYVESGDDFDDHAADTQQSDPEGSSPPPTGIPDTGWLYIALSTASFLFMTVLYKRHCKYSDR